MVVMCGGDDDQFARIGLLRFYTLAVVVFSFIFYE